LPSVRNQGLDVSHGEYIAWLDCDDVSVPERLEKQVSFLDKNSHIGICGGWAKIIDNDKMIIKHPSDPEYIKSSLLFYNCLVNSTVMMRSACIQDIGLRFDSSHYLSQDYGLWTRVARNWKITNLSEVLVMYNIHTKQITNIHKQKQIDISWEIQKEQLSKLGIVPTENERVIHMGLGGFIKNAFEDASKILKVKEYLIKLDRANNKHKIYDRQTFQKVLLERWLDASNSKLSSTFLMLTSYWMKLRFNNMKISALHRAMVKIGRNITRYTRNLN
jgi:glycosyltransferase involved in cell wall biosynthesis